MFKLLGFSMLFYLFEKPIIWFYEHNHLQEITILYGSYC